MLQKDRQDSDSERRAIVVLLSNGGSVVMANMDISPMKLIAWNCVHGEDALCWDCLARSEDNIRRTYAEEEEEVDDNEVENSINQNTSMDSIVFEHNADDEDTE